MATTSSSSSSSNIWDEILNSVSGRTSSSVAKKNLIVLGEPQTGKSTLLSHILKGASSSLLKPISLPSTVKTLVGGSPARLDLATGYEWVDVREEGDEETLPPLSIYTPPSSHPSLLRLLPLSLSQPPPPPPTTASTSSSPSTSVLADTSILIVLDWTKPASMISQLLGWLEWVDEWSKDVVKGREVEGEENRERLQYHLQHYNEPAPPLTMSSPSLGGTSPTKQAVPLPPAPLPTASIATYNPNSSEVLPLGPGTLTRNAYGVPITIVCTKADQIDVVAEELGFGGGPAGGGGSGGKGGGSTGGKGGWEERTDWIGQVLRLVALMHGASLFYTSQASPSTFTLLRAYLLHRIFSPPAPILSSSTITTTTTTSNQTQAQPQTLPINPSSSLLQPSSIISTSTRFPFPHRANVLDRDQVLVPSGWDSWGKIMVLREGFEPERVTSAWEVSGKRRKVERGEGGEGEEVEEEEEDVEDLWEGVVPEMGEEVVQDPSARMTTTLVDQTFLAKEYALIQNDPKRDPRQSFRNPASSSTSSSSSSAYPSSSGGGAGGGGGELERLVGVVGPMGSGGLSMPGVEKVMADMEGLSFGSGKKDSRPSLSSRDYSYNTSSPPLPSSLSPLTSPSLAGSNFPSSSSSSAVAAAGSTITPGAGQPPPSTEALHNFFQSLLTARKNTTGGVAGLPGASSPSAAAAPSSSSASPSSTRVP